MKTDLYTKAILTIIALFLGVLSFDKVYDATIPEAQAKTGKWECLPTMRGAGLKQFEPDEIANTKGWTFMTMLPVNGEAEVYYCGRP